MDKQKQKGLGISVDMYEKKMEKPNSELLSQEQIDAIVNQILFVSTYRFACKHKECYETFESKRALERHQLQTHLPKDQQPWYIEWL